MLRGCEPSHVLYQTEYGNIDRLTGEHRDSLPCIGECHFLRSAHDNNSCDWKSLYKGQVYVARSRRHVDKEIIEFAPPCVCYQLFQGVACHASSPEDRFLLVDKETDGEHLDSVSFYRFNPVASFLVYHIELFIFDAEHFRHRRTEYIGIKKTYLITLCRECHCEIGGDCGFSNTSLAGADSNDILYSRKHCRFCRSCCGTCLDGDIHFDIRRYGSGNRRFGGSNY